MAFFPSAGEPRTEMEGMKGKLAPHSHPFFDNHNKMPSMCKPRFEETCSIWGEDIFAPSVAVTPDSVLVPPHGDSPPLDREESSPFDLDEQQMQFLIHNTRCDDDFPDRGHFYDMMTDGDHTMEESYESYMYPYMTYLSSPVFLTDCQAFSEEDYEEHSKEDALVMSDSFVENAATPAFHASDLGNTKHDMIVENAAKPTFHSSDLGNTKHDMIAACVHGEKHAQKQQLVVGPSPSDVVAVLRQHIKEYLERKVKEELALCGCAHTIKEKNDDEGGCNPTLDHHLDCKMRTDYGIWVMWMQERRMRNEGIDLVQRLLACAEAVACRDAYQAQSLLQGVQELASPFGDSLQRVAFCFMRGLAARLNQHNNAGSTHVSNLFPASAAKGLGFTIKYKMQFLSSGSYSHTWNTPEETLGRQEAFQSMYDVCPYVPFGHFIANSVLLEALEGEEAIHVIDLGTSDSLQWSALIQELATRPGGPPKLLRITSVGTFTSQIVEEVGEALHEEATKASLNFEFNAVLQPLEDIAAADLNIRAGEVIVVNSVLRLHCVVKESRGSLNIVLNAIHGLSPKVLTLVEQDANHNGPFFLGRFMEALHYYSAIFDSLQSALPRHSTRRINIEQRHLAHEIRNIVACEGPTRVERHERVDQWRRRMSRAGFQLAPIRQEGQARHWLSAHYAAFKEDYTLSDEKGCLVLGWKGKPIIAASAWRR